MLSLIIKELKMQRKGLIIWIIASGLFIAAGLAKSSGFVSTTDSGVLELLDNFPPVITAMYGFNGLDMSTFEGYYGVMVNFMFLIVAIHAITTSFKLFAIEEIDKTYEYIYSKPISKKVVVTSKVIATTILAILFNIGLFIADLLSVLPNYSDGTSYIGFITENHFRMLLVQLFFIGVSYVIISLKKEVANSTKLGALAMLGFYFLGVISEMLDETTFLADFTPFKFLDTVNLINGTTEIYAYIVPISVFIVGIAMLITLKPNQEVVG